METIFDHKPTNVELKAIGIDYVTMALRHGVNISDPIIKKTYTVDQDAAYFDIALLFEHRGDKTAAGVYWDKIPTRYQEYTLGFDDIASAE